MALTKEDEQGAHRGSVFFPNPLADADTTLPRAPPDGAGPITSAKPHEAGPPEPPCRDDTQSPALEDRSASSLGNVIIVSREIEE